MKLLKDFSEKKLSQEDVTITVKPLTKALIDGYISTMFEAVDMGAFERQMVLVEYILRNALENVYIEGEGDIDPIVIADNAIVTDTDTARQLRIIFELFDKEVDGLGEDEQKKSQQLQDAG